MINKMREMAPIIMLIILIAFVGGTIFLDWGMNITSRLTNKATYAGKINGKEIPLNYFERLVNMERQKLEQNGGSSASPAQYRQVPNQVWEQEVNRILTRDAFRKMDISASPDEVFESIKRNPLPGLDTASVFMTNGVFDTSKYVSFLNNPDNYDTYPWLKEIETYYRDIEVPTQKLQMLLSAATVPSKDEIAYQYKLMKERGKFEYVKVNGLAFKVDNGAITDAKIKTYYDAHQDSFFVDNPQAGLYYVKFPKIATAQDEKVYYDEMVELKNRIKSSEQFAEEAKVESDDESTAQNGGDLGWFGKGQMVGPFDSVALSIDTGKISDPIRTSFGIHLILVEKREVQNGEIKVNARHILRKIVPTMETLDRISSEADSLRIQMLDKGFVLAAKAANGNVQLDSTGMFKKGEAIPGIGFVSGVNQYAFNADKKEISERLENNDAYYLFSIKAVLKKGVEPLAVAKPQIVKILSLSIRETQAKDFAEKLAPSVQGLASFKDLQVNDSLVASNGVTDTITQNDYIPGVGYGSKVAAVAFALPQGKISKVFKQGSNYFIVRTLWKQTIDQIPWDSPEVMQIEQTMRSQSAQRVYMDWYTNYKRSAKIISRVNDIYAD